MRPGLALSLLIVVVMSAIPAKAASLEEKWEAAGEASGRCPRFLAHITVTKNTIVIAIGGQDTCSIRGTVAADESFTAGKSADRATGQFSGDAVQLTLTTPCGVRTGAGHRAS